MNNNKANRKKNYDYSGMTVRDLFALVLWFVFGVLCIIGLVFAIVP